MEKLHHNKKKTFLDITAFDLFLFTGSQLDAAPFDTNHGTRNFVGHFEEYVRWTHAKDSEALREKFVLTNTYPNQSVYTLNNAFKKEIADYQPSVVSYLINPQNDFVKTETEFIKNLLEVVTQVLQLKNGQAKFVLLVPSRTSDEYKNAQLTTYLRMFNEQLEKSFDENELSRIFVVNVFEDKDISKHVNDLGQLDEVGHLKLGEKFARAIYDQVTNFPGEGVELSLTLKQEQLVPDDYLTETIDQQLEDLLNSKESLTWLFMGDSITHGALWTFGYKDYVELISQYVRETFNRKSDDFINTAVSGATIPSTLNRIEQRLEPYNPDIISVKLGANDLVSYTPAEYKENLETLLKHLYKKDALIILSTPTPSNRGEMENKRLIEYIAVLEEIVEKHPKLLFVNHYSDLQNFLNENPEGWEKEYTFYTDEVLHLGANGQLFMFHNFIKYLHLTKVDSVLLNYYYVSKEEDALIVKEVFNTLYS